ncbi:WD domain-containing protein [Durotheca rogersii]|uniref:WD domain-containing protein n=1 Tax=Durotheca rogersii TaxID=419775 RepID=UPI00221FD06B|nr:WD domain-containing protein [Durotheca rogersii]KAI5861916.1 WD domain-containing protein [Durotheca rogersii]
MASLATNDGDAAENNAAFDIVQHGHKDLVQAVAFNAYGDRCATGSVDGKIRVFNRHQDGIWRLCDNWKAHAGEILELQWLPPTIYPNLLASLGIEGRFQLWAEDPSAPPGRRFSMRDGNGKPVSEVRSSRYPFRSFSVKHDEVTRCTYVALLASDGHLTVYEGEVPEALTDYAKFDDFQAFAKPNRGEETCFKVRFDPNPEPCYTALRAGLPSDALSLVVSGLTAVKIFRTRDIVTSSFGTATRSREFYLALEITEHAHLVRDVAWAPGNYRGYEMIATACQDGFVRVFRIDTPFSKDDGKTWSPADILGSTRGDESTAPRNPPSRRQSQAPSGIRAEIDKSGTHGERLLTDQPGQIRHTVKVLSKLSAHRSPVWRVGFDDDGQILGSVGDEGKLMCYRQLPDGSWAKSSELGMMKTRMAAPPVSHS